MSQQVDACCASYAAMLQMKQLQLTCTGMYLPAYAPIQAWLVYQTLHMSAQEHVENVLDLPGHRRQAIGQLATILKLRIQVCSVAAASCLLQLFTSAAFCVASYIRIRLRSLCSAAVASHCTKNNRRTVFINGMQHTHWCISLNKTACYWYQLGFCICCMFALAGTKLWITRQCGLGRHAGTQAFHGGPDRVRRCVSSMLQLTTGLNRPADIPVNTSIVLLRLTSQA
jgi:hypothetical protein